MSDISLQSALVSSYLPDFSIKKVIGHDTLLYREIMVKYFVLLMIISIIGRLVRQIPRIDAQIIRRTTSVLIIVIYAKCLYHLIDEYLDTLVITSWGLVLFRRNSPFAKSMSVIQRVAIESVQHKHAWIRESVFRLWDISFHVEDTVYTFKRVNSPLQTVSQVLKRKQQLSWHPTYENQPLVPSWQEKKYDLLLEALGEVMHEYIEKKDSR